MIVVGSSVWIDLFNGVSIPEVERQLDGLLGLTSLAIGDLILGEAMQGFRNERDAAIARQLFRSLALQPRHGSRQWPLIFKKTAMASGITVTSNPDPAQLESLGVKSRPTWGCEVSTFPWTYDEQETCLLLQGDVTVTPKGGEPVHFDAGLSCTWDVHAPVRKHYRFG